MCSWYVLVDWYYDMDWAVKMKSTLLLLKGTLIYVPGITRLPFWTYGTCYTMLSLFLQLGGGVGWGGGGGHFLTSQAVGEKGEKKVRWLLVHSCVCVCTKTEQSVTVNTVTLFSSSLFNFKEEEKRTAVVHFRQIFPFELVGYKRPSHCSHEKHHLSV